MRLAWLLPLGLGVLGVAWVSIGAGLIPVVPLPTAGATVNKAAGALHRHRTPVEARGPMGHPSPRLARRQLP